MVPSTPHCSPPPREPASPRPPRRRRGRLLLAARRSQMLRSVAVFSAVSYASSDAPPWSRRVITPRAPLTLGVGTEPVKWLLHRGVIRAVKYIMTGQEFPVQGGSDRPATVGADT